MAFTNDDLNAIDMAIASGVKRVTFADGRTTEYQSTDDMIRARQLISGQVATASRPRRRFAIFRTGL